MSDGSSVVAVIMTCYNRKALTLDCLQHLYASDVSGLSIRVYLVDDLSSDGTPEAVRALFPAVTILSGTGELFWGGGMRLAMATAIRDDAECDYLLWLNDDVLLRPNALRRLVAVNREMRALLQADSITVGATVDPISTVQTYGGVWRPSRLRPMAFQLVPISFDSYQPCDTMNGNVVLIPRSINNQVGPIDEIFTHAMGDFDYGLRASALGFSLYVSPSVSGYCSLNSANGTYRDSTLPRRARVRHALSVKGLPIRQWISLCRRHAGPLWVLPALSPYAKLLFRRRR